MWECLGSLTDCLTPTDALTLLDDVPEMLRGHEAMAGVTARVIEVLADEIDTGSYSPTAPQTQTIQKFANALAKVLGPVAQFFNESSWISGLDNLAFTWQSPDRVLSRPMEDKSFYTCLPLKPHVLALSPTVMEALLKSDALEVTTENEVYTLMGCWLVQSPFAGACDGSHEVPWANCLSLFRRLVQHVRLQHLSLEYVLNVVTACPLAAQSALLPSILSLGLATRQPNSDLLLKEGGVEPLPTGNAAGILPPQLICPIFSRWRKTRVCASI